MQDLFKKYIENNCSAEEVKSLLEYFNIPENEAFARTIITEQLQTEYGIDDKTVPGFTAATAQTFINIKKQIAAEKSRVVPLYRKTWFRVAAAAVFIIGLISILKFVNNNTVSQPGFVKTIKAPADIVPGGNKAILTLADGSTIILDSAVNGNLPSQGNTKVEKLNGQLVYSASGQAKEILYNTISTPRGGNYQVLLADGSVVWLNAASSLHFPASFAGKERRVVLTGEGYFEVAKNAAMPFIVEITGKGEVEVLGTHFNVNAYDDEALVKTTLLEGVVRIKKDNNIQLLLPGQQGRFAATGNIALLPNADIEETMAWKNGKFVFTGNDIQSVMRQLQKWYDIEVEYQGAKTNEEFVGVISRNVNISQILTMLEKTKTVNFEIINRKVIVKN